MKKIFCIIAIILTFSFVLTSCNLPFGKETETGATTPEETTAEAPTETTTEKPDETTVTRSLSNGCIRMRNKDVEKLYCLVPSGVPVVIRD